MTTSNGACLSNIEAASFIKQPILTWSHVYRKNPTFTGGVAASASPELQAQTPGSVRLATLPGAGDAGRTSPDALPGSSSTLAGSSGPALYPCLICKGHAKLLAHSCESQVKAQLARDQSTRLRQHLPLHKMLVRFCVWDTQESHSYGILSGSMKWRINSFFQIIQSSKMKGIR